MPRFSLLRAVKSMGKAPKYLIGILVALALLPSAIKTVSTSFDWIAAHIRSLESRRAEEERQKELVSTSCTAKERSHRARELRGDPPNSSDYGAAQRIAAAYWVAVGLSTESEQDCLERTRNLTSEK